jgi:site-specific DNA recombinase
MSNALIYLRVSTKEQAEKGESGEGYSIPGQREACLRYCAEKGWDVADEFIDAGESAKSADRPSLKALLRRIAEEDIGAVVVHKIDRLARNIEDHVAIRAALRKYGCQLVSVTENIEETASGKLVEGIHALMAEFYSANLAAEVRKGMTQKAKQGQWPGKAPIGYLNDIQRRDGKEIKRIVLDPERAILVKEAFRLYATGEYSLAEMQTELTAKGFTSPNGRRPGAAVPISGLARMLANPFYIGIVEWGGVHYQGQHKPSRLGAALREGAGGLASAERRRDARAHPRAPLEGTPRLRRVWKTALPHTRQGEIPLLLLPRPEERASPQDRLFAEVCNGDRCGEDGRGYLPPGPASPRVGGAA